VSVQDFQETGCTPVWLVFDGRNNWRCPGVRNVMAGSLGFRGLSWPALGPGTGFIFLFSSHFFFFMVLGFEHRASSLLDCAVPLNSLHQPYFMLGFSR
jgi:hypothetical protein